VAITVLLEALDGILKALFGSEAFLIPTSYNVYNFHSPRR